MARKPESKRKILTISCPDGMGIVAAVSGVLTDNGAFLTEAAQFGDGDTECAVLARAVRWHAERRVLLNGVKTAVFR